MAGNALEIMDKRILGNIGRVDVNEPLNGVFLVSNKTDNPIRQIVQLSNGPYGGTNLNTYGYVSSIGKGQLDELGISKVDAVDVNGVLRSIDHLKEVGEIKLSGVSFMDEGTPYEAGSQSFIEYILGIDTLGDIDNSNGIIKNIFQNGHIDSINNGEFGTICAILQNKRIDNISNRYGATIRRIRGNNSIGTLNNAGKIEDEIIVSDMAVLENSNYINKLILSGGVGELNSKKPSDDEFKKYARLGYGRKTPENSEGSTIVSLEIYPESHIHSWDGYPFKVGAIDVSEEARIPELLSGYLLNAKEVGNTYGIDTLGLTEADRYTLLRTSPEELSNQDFEFLKTRV